MNNESQRIVDNRSAARPDRSINDLPWSIEAAVSFVRRLVRQAIENHTRMYPIDAFNETFNKLLPMFGAILGLNVLNPNYQLSAHHLFVLFVVTSMTSSCAYTVLTASFEIKLQAFVVGCFCAEGLIKLVCIRKNCRKLAQAKQDLEAIYHVNNSSEQTAIAKIGQKTLWTMKTLLTLYNSCLIAFVCLPMLHNFFAKKMNLPLPAYLPCVDPRSSHGFMILAVFHSVFAVFGTSALGFSDALFGMIAFNSMTFSSLIAEQTQQLNGIMTDASVENKPALIRWKWRNLILMHQEMQAYFRNVDECFTMIKLLEVCTC